MHGSATNERLLITFSAMRRRAVARQSSYLRVGGLLIALGAFGLFTLFVSLPGSTPRPNSFDHSAPSQASQVALGEARVPFTTGLHRASAGAVEQAVRTVERLAVPRREHLQIVPDEDTENAPLPPSLSPTAPHTAPPPASASVGGSAESSSSLSSSSLSHESPQTFEEAFDQYAAVHHKQATSGVPTKGVLTLHCWGGFNNCALASTSALILAMLTNRTLMVHRSADQEAFARTMNQTRFKWVMDNNQIDTYHQHLGRKYPGMRGEWRMDSPMNIRVDRFPIGDLMCSNFSQAFADELIDIHANNYFLPAIAANPLYRATIDAWFGNEEEPKYARVYRKLVVPSDRVLAIKKQFLGEVTGGTSNCIGVQVRTTMNKDNQQAITALRQIISSIPADVKPILYVASDNQGVRDMVSRFASEQGLKAGFVNSVPLHELAREENFDYSVAETLAVAECEWGLVVTRGSTFGYTITALSKARTVIRFGGDGSPEQPFQIRLDGKFREPIYHGQFQGYPPQHAPCFASLNLNVGTAFGWRVDMT